MDTRSSDAQNPGHFEGVFEDVNIFLKQSSMCLNASASKAMKGITDFGSSPCQRSKCPLISATLTYERLNQLLNVPASCGQ